MSEDTQSTPAQSTMPAAAPTQSITDAVKAAIEKSNPGAAVTVTPTIPARVAGNICKMLEKTPLTGMEAVAWCEAYQLLQQIVIQSQQTQGPGVPFTGFGG